MKDKQSTPEQERKYFMAYLEESLNDKIKCYGAEHPITLDVIAELEQEKAKDAAQVKTATENPL